jgi:hypothetical protein
MLSIEFNIKEFILIWIVMKEKKKRGRINIVRKINKLKKRQYLKSVKMSYLKNKKLVMI